MSNQDEDLLHGGDEGQPPPAWWSPSSLLTPEVTSITAFTIALISISTFGIGSSMLVTQSLLAVPAGPSDLRALNLMGAVILLLMALGAILLARRVFRQAEPWCAQWARHLAGAAAAVAALSTVLNTTALIAALLRTRPPAPCPDPVQPSHLMEDDDVRLPARSGIACHRGRLGTGPRPRAAAPAPPPRGRHAVADPGRQGVRERAGRQVDVTRITHGGRAGSQTPLRMSGGTGPVSRRRGLASQLCQAAGGERGGFAVVSRIWVVAIGVVALAASCTSGSSAGPGAGGPAATPAPAGSAGRVCTPRACISLSRLARSIDAQLKGNVVGYVALVGQSQVVASGLARTAADPPQLAMGPNVMVNVASVGKMFTTIAVLKSLAWHHLSIDSRIWPFLPPDWVKGPGIDTITFRELLTHRAGFRLDSGRVFETDNAAREQIRQGIQQIDKQVADYNNINFTIFRDMLPFMEGVREPGPAARAAAATRFFISYVQRQVFDPVSVKDATCAPVRDALLMYPPPYAGTARGRPALAGPSACSGGGWFMTPASMRRVLDGLISGNSLLSGRQRQQMDGNCLGWDCSVAGQAGYRGKYGGIGDPGSAGLQIFFGILAGTIPVVIAANSNGPTLQAVVQTALLTATSAR